MTSAGSTRSNWLEEASGNPQRTPPAGVECLHATVRGGHEYSFSLSVPAQELSVLNENETIVSTADVLGDEGTRIFFPSWRTHTGVERAQGKRNDRFNRQCSGRRGEELKTGDVGAIVHVHPGNEAVVVEFMSLDATTVAIATVLSSEASPVRSSDITHARTIAAAV